MEQCILHTQQNFWLKVKNWFLPPPSPITYSKIAFLYAMVCFFFLPSNKRSMPDCHLSVTPIPLQISRNRLWPQLPGFSHSCGARHIHLFLGSRFLCGSVLSARVNRVLINGSQGVQSPGAAVPSLLLVSLWESASQCVFTAVRCLRCSPLCPTLLNFCLIPSPADTNGFKTHLQKLRSHSPGLAHEAETVVETKDKRFQKLEPEIDKD